MAAPDQTRNKIPELLPKLRPSGVTDDQPWCVVPAMPYWPSGASGPIKLFLYPSCLDIIERGRTREYARNVESYAELYQAGRYTSDDPERRENLCSVGNKTRTIDVPRTLLPGQFLYNCTIFYGAPAPTLAAHESSRLTWEAVRAVYYHIH